MDYLHDYDNYTNTYSMLIQSGWIQLKLGCW